MPRSCKKAYDKWLQDQQLKDPSLIDNDPELKQEVDKLRGQGLLYQRKEEDRRRNDRRLAYYDDLVYLNGRVGVIV